MTPVTRKRAADHDEDGPGGRRSKPQKSKKQKLPATLIGEDGDEETFQTGPAAAQQQHDEQESETPFGKMDSQLIGDYMARQTKRFEPDLSLVELEDRRVPASAILDTSDFAQQRSLPNLPAFLENVTGKSKEALARSAITPGAPHTLVIAAAGLRAAELARTLRVYQTKDATVAKLFAKHIKLKDAVEFAKKTRMSIGVGTPQRIIDLIGQGALSLSKVQHVVIDGSYTNEKKRSIFSMGDTAVPLTRLMSQEAFREGFEGEKIKVVVY